MGRSQRILLPYLIYHVLNRGNGRQPIFYEDDDFEKYLEILKRYKEKFQFHLYAYVLMTNHVHLLIEPTERGTLSQIMQETTLAHYGGPEHKAQYSYAQPFTC